MKQLNSSFQILACTRKRTEWKTWKFNKLDGRVDFSNLPFNICIENLKPNVLGLFFVFVFFSANESAH